MIGLMSTEPGSKLSDSEINMPLGEGWWLNQKGKHIEVMEHLYAVQERPKTFGLTRKNVAQEIGESADDARVRILTRVMKNGWIRVRSYKGTTVFEYWNLSRRVADAIWEFIVNVLGGGAASTYRMSEVKSQRVFEVSSGQFYEDVDNYLSGLESSSKDYRLPLDGGNTLYLIGRSAGQGRMR